MIRAYFMHIPKTGGTSIMMALRQHCWVERGDIGFNGAADVIAAHQPMAFWLAQPKRFIFTWLRHPIDVAESYMRYVETQCHDMRQKARQAVLLKGGVDEYIAEFVRDGFFESYLQSGAMLRVFDFIGFTARMQHDFDRLMKLLGLPLCVVGTANRSEGGARFNDVQRKRLETKLAGDIALYKEAWKRGA